MRAATTPLPAVLVLGLVAIAPNAAQITAQTTPARPRITGIDHVAYRASDSAASRRFYADVLGLTEQPSPAGRVAFAIGRQRLLLEPGPGLAHDDRLSHIAFATPDAASLAAFLTSRGVHVDSGDAQGAGSAERCGDAAFRITDPDGHTIEFVQVAWPPETPATLAQGRALSARLLHTGILVRDEAAANRLYRDVLGFSEIWRGGRNEGVTDWVNMRVPDSTDYVEFMLASAQPDRRQLGSMHHIALLVTDMQAAWDAAAARTPADRRAALSPPQVGRNGRWQLNLYDPDGTRTELMEPFRVR